MRQMKDSKQILAAKAELNRMIAEAQTAERRTLIKTIGVNLLIAAKSYKGFNYTEWLDSGHAAWIAAGRPEDNTKFFGDTTKVVFY